MTIERFLKEVEGLFVPKFFSTQCFLSALHFEPKPGELFIVTYPKCGTTWMQNIVISILRKGEPLAEPRDFFLASPFLDQLGGEDLDRLRIQPGALKTHLPFNRVPWSPEAKYIYVARNVKDCCVSFYHHVRDIPGYQFADGTFDEFFDLFIQGELEFGDYFDHLMSWYEHRHDPNVFFITYEEMKSNPSASILRVANFLGKEYGDLLINDAAILEKVLRYSSFDYMKIFINKALEAMYQISAEKLLSDPNIPEGRKHIVAYNASLPPQQGGKIDFVRKGEIGDWVNYLNPEQCRRLEERALEKTAGSDVMKLWEKNCPSC